MSFHSYRVGDIIRLIKNPKDNRVAIGAEGKVVISDRAGVTFLLAPHFIVTITVPHDCAEPVPEH